MIKQEAAHVCRSKKPKSNGPAPLPSPTTAPRHFRHQPRPCATSATLRHFRRSYLKPRPLPAQSRPGTSIPQSTSSFATTGCHCGQARRGGAPPQLHRNSTAPPRHRNSTAHHLLFVKDADDLKLFFLTALPYLSLSSYPASPASRSCAKLLLLQFSM